MVFLPLDDLEIIVFNYNEEEKWHLQEYDLTKMSQENESNEGDEYFHGKHLRNIL